MRSFEPFGMLDEIEKKCLYSACARKFYTINKKAKYCCDSHRAKGFRELHAERLNETKDWNKNFENNTKILAELYRREIKSVSQRELRIAGFSFKSMRVQKTIENERICFVFRDWILVSHPEKGGEYEIKKLTKAK